MGLVKIGSLAPQFNLLNQDGELVNLKDFRGVSSVILYFDPKAMTPGCTVQACGLRDIKTKLKKFNAVALGLSPDPVNKLNKFQEKYNLNFPLLYDEDHKIAEKYGVWALKKFMGKEFMGVLRTTFLIDEKGHIEDIISKVKTKSHHDDVLNLLKKRVLT